MSADRPLALTLSVRNFDRLANGAPREMLLDRRSATIGRASSTDWSLPDPELHISGRHCDILFRNGGYELVDNSTNGTFVNASDHRLSGPHRLQNGDVIRIGKYEVAVKLGTPPAESGALPAGGSAQSAAPSPAPATPAPLPAGDDDIWNKFAASNSIDWERGGFGGAAPTPAPPAPPVAPVAFSPSPAAAPVQTPAPRAETPAEAPRAPAPAAAGSGLDALLSGAGLDRETVHQDPGAALEQAGKLLRNLVAGMVVMLEARARAKSQMGAQGTGLEITGNNPLKFARSPEQALRHILNPAERGFMDADRAIEDGWRDLQAHQLATLKAMQGALRSTLERFSPKSIRGRAETRGMLEKILPGARDAALWKAYEREFSGVAFDSDEAFMDMFSKEFRKAYDDISHGS